MILKVLPDSNLALQQQTSMDLHLKLPMHSRFVTVNLNYFEILAILVGVFESVDLIPHFGGPVMLPGKAYKGEPQ